MASGKNNESVLAWGAAVIAEQAKRVGQSIKTDLTKGTGPPIAREAIKDVRNSIHQVFFGQAEPQGELGAPLNPLQSEVADARREVGEAVRAPGKSSLYGKDAVHGGKALDPKRLPSPSEVAKEREPCQPPPPDRGNGQEQGKSTS